MTTGPPDVKVTTAAGGPGGMQLALRFNEGLGVFGIGKQGTKSMNHILRGRLRARRRPSRVAVQEEKFFSRRTLVVRRMLAVAVALPLSFECAASVFSDEVFKFGCGSHVTLPVGLAHEVHQIAHRSVFFFKHSEVRRQSGDELASSYVPCIKFRHRLQMMELPVNRLQRQPVGEQYAKECPGDAHAAGDEGNRVVTHRAWRTYLFALGGGASGIGIGLLMGLAWVKWMIKTPNVRVKPAPTA